MELAVLFRETAEIPPTFRHLKQVCLKMLSSVNDILGTLSCLLIVMLSLTESLSFRHLTRWDEPRS